MKSWALFLSLGMFAGAATGCSLLTTLPLDGTGALAPPTVTYQGAELVQSPSEKLLAAYYCPEVANLPFNSSAVVCQGFFGARPTPAEMSVAFELKFKVGNPNKVPVPLATILTAVTVFPEATSTALGAVCTQLCPEGQPGCGATRDPNACQSSSRDIRSLSDFQGAATNLLSTQGLAFAAGQAPTFVAPKVAAGAELMIVVRFAFGPQQMLSVLKQVALASADQLKTGKTPTFQIPFKIEGTVFFDAGSIGRIPVGFGPVAGTWQLPTQGLLPSATP